MVELCSAAYDTSIGLRIECQHSGKALSTALRALKKARRMLQLQQLGCDVFVEPELVEEAGDTATLYLNVWKGGARWGGGSGGTAQGQSQGGEPV